MTLNSWQKLLATVLFSTALEPGIKKSTNMGWQPKPWALLPLTHSSFPYVQSLDAQRMTHPFPGALKHWGVCAAPLDSLSSENPRPLLPTTHPDSSFPFTVCFVESGRSDLLCCLWRLMKMSPGIEVYHPGSIYQKLFQITELCWIIPGVKMKGSKSKNEGGS